MKGRQNDGQTHMQDNIPTVTVAEGISYQTSQSKIELEFCNNNHSLLVYSQAGFFTSGCL